MSTKTPAAKESTATEPPADLPARATYIGTDGDGDRHFWDYYCRTIYVVGDDRDEHELPEGVTLAEWGQHVKDKRGAWSEYRVGGSLVELLGAALEEQ